MSLDVLTPRGRETVEDENAAAEIFERRTDYKYIRTPKSSPARVDAIIAYEGVMKFVAETKCRYDCDLNKMMNEWNGEALIQYHKVISLAECSILLCVPSILLTYLVDDRLLLVKRITDSNGKVIARMRTEITATQATCNGDQKIERVNAYIDVSEACRYT